MRAVLISACGPATYRIIKDVLTPEAPSTVDFDTIVEKLTQHFQPVPNQIAQRCKFFSRIRRPHESIAEYVAQLKKLVEHCQFGDKLNEMLRDRLVCGVANVKWQQRLLSEEALTYDRTLKLLLAMEAAEKEARDISGIKDVHNVHHKRLSPIYNSHPKPHPEHQRSKSCSRCGGNHNQANCSFINEECFYCHKKGHISAVCFQKRRDSKQPRRSPQDQQYQHSERKQNKIPRRFEKKPTHKVEETTESEQSSEYQMYNCHTVESQPLCVELLIQGALLSMEVDTGATLSIISRQTYDTAWTGTQVPPIKPSNVKLRTYMGEGIPVDGAIEVDVSYQDQKAHLNLLVVAGNGPSLMGRDWLSHVKLDWTKLHQLQIDPTNDLEKMIDRHKDLFKQELGKIKGVTAKLYLNANTQPMFYRARPVPFSVRAKVEVEIDRQVKMGILEPVQFSEWATPVVPILKGDGSIRLCGDYKVTVNRETKVDTYPLPRIEDIHASLAGGTMFTKLDLSHAYQQVMLDEETKQCVTINTHKGLYQVN